MFYQKIVRTLLENCTAGSVKNAKNTSNSNKGQVYVLKTCGKIFEKIDKETAREIEDVGPAC